MSQIVFSIVIYTYRNVILTTAIFMTEGDFYLGRLKIQAVSDTEVVKKTPSDYQTLRQCCVKFTKLSPQQQARLQ